MNALQSNGLCCALEVYGGENFNDSYAKLLLRLFADQVQFTLHQNATDFVTNIQTALLEQIVVYDGR